MVALRPAHFAVRHTLRVAARRCAQQNFSILGPIGIVSGGEYLQHFGCLQTIKREANRGQRQPALLGKTSGPGPAWARTGSLVLSDRHLAGGLKSVKPPYL